MPKPHSLTHAQNARSRTGQPTYPKGPRVLCQQDSHISPLSHSMGCIPPSTGVPNLSFPISLCSLPNPDLKIRLKGTGGGWICPFSDARKWKASISASLHSKEEAKHQLRKSNCCFRACTWLHSGPTAQESLSPPALPDPATPPCLMTCLMESQTRKGK